MPPYSYTLSLLWNWTQPSSKTKNEEAQHFYRVWPCAEELCMKDSNVKISSMRFMSSFGLFACCLYLLIVIFCTIFRLQNVSLIRVTLVHDCYMPSTSWQTFTIVSVSDEPGFTTASKWSWLIFTDPTSHIAVLGILSTLVNIWKKIQ